MKQTKYAIFIIGNRGSGKTTLIRALTGVGRFKFPWNLRKLNGQPMKAFVLSSAIQEMGMRRYPPSTFPNNIEAAHKVNRKDYDILICPLEILVRNQQRYGYERYIENAIQQGFDSRIAVINIRQNGAPTNLNLINGCQAFSRQYKTRMVLANASDDPHVTSTYIRDNLYP